MAAPTFQELKTEFPGYDKAFDDIATVWTAAEIYERYPTKEAMAQYLAGFGPPTTGGTASASGPAPDVVYDTNGNPWYKDGDNWKPYPYDVPQAGPPAPPNTTDPYIYDYQKGQWKENLLYSPEPADLPGENEQFYWTGSKWDVNPVWKAKQDQMAADRQFGYQTARDISDRDLRRQELIMQWDARAPRPAVFTPELQAPQIGPPPESTPRNWINYWLWDEQRKRPQYDPTQFIPGQTPPIATDALDAASKGFKNWITPEQWGQATGNINMERQRIYDPTAADVDPMTGTRPETDEEYHYRTVVVPQLDVAAGNIWGNATAGYQTDSTQDYMTGWAKANPAPNQGDIYYDEVMGGTPGQFDADMANWRAKADEERRNYAGENWAPKPLGPKAPEWAKGVLQSQTLAGRSTANPWLQTPVSYGQGQINMRKLGTEGNTVKPVSAQMYQNWLPSQQQGYFGLAEAQQAEKGQGVDLGDYMDNVQKMWTSSRTGQQGQRRARAY